MRDLIVHQVNISHYRLVELAKLADQAKPFFDWVERIAKKETGSHKNLSEILLSATKKQIKEIIAECYQANAETCPLLFDGIGRVYKHPKACFFFFAWMVRDAPQQRLAPLISRMQKAYNISKLIAETDTLVALISEYRGVVGSFEWSVVREIFIDRLEGSRRSISGHRLESSVRTSLVTAIQHFYSINNNYGKFARVEIAEKQIKIGQHSVDISVELFPKDGGQPLKILIPVKTRETEGGGHSHLFTRDIASAITDIRKSLQNVRILSVIIAANWSATEISNMGDSIDLMFHFNMAPNKFVGFDNESQIRLNKYIAKLLQKGG